MSKPKPRAIQAAPTGVYKSEVVKDVAESLGVASISEAVASALASDVEYRIHQVVEEASRFMRHARRTTMTTADIDQALRVLNIEPLYGHSSHNPPSFRRAGPAQAGASGSSTAASAPVYFVEDEEIEFDRVLREDKVSLPKPVSWTAHWLAVEGVQPLIPENPPAIPRDTGDLDPAKLAVKTGAASVAAGARAPPLSGTSGLAPGQPPSKKLQLQQQQLVKQVLSRELQLYYSRLTTSLLSETEDVKRTAALASLRHDAGLQALLPYLVRWVGEGVVGMLKMDEAAHSESDGRTLEVYLDVIGALLDNSTLFVEPYLHQLLPPTLSILLHSSLPPQHSRHLRTTASQTLSHLLTQHSTTYPSLAPRIMKTLLLALVSPGRSKSTREGAVRGLTAVGKEAIRKGVVEGGGAKVVGSESSPHERSGAVEAILDALNVLHPPSSMAVPLRQEDEADAALYARLQQTFGDLFAQRLSQDAEQARSILSSPET